MLDGLMNKTKKPRKPPKPRDVEIAPVQLRNSRRDIYDNAKKSTLGKPHKQTEQLACSTLWFWCIWNELPEEIKNIAIEWGQRELRPMAAKQVTDIERKKQYKNLIKAISKKK